MRLPSYQRLAVNLKNTLLLFLLLLSACNSSKVKDAIDLIEGVPAKDIDPSMVGVNAFGSDDRFGSVNAQMSEVKNTLRLSYVRVLFAWTDAVQSGPSVTPNFSFYDDVLDAVPAGVDVLVVMTGLPSWMTNSTNWLDGNPRTTFVEKWVRAVISRYKANAKIVGWEIWNEPNMSANPDNTTLGVATSPANYVEMLARAFDVSRSLTSAIKVVSAATTAINQNYPDTIDYNRGMRDAGAQNFADIWGVHLYGEQYENIIRGGGVGDFLGGLSLPIWVTESGAQGVDEQLDYVRHAWPFLLDHVAGIQRFYYYQFAEATPPATTYGLRNLDPVTPVSDLYLFFRDRP